MNRILCWLGIHNWRFSYGSMSIYGVIEKTKIRTCAHCGLQQRWLPGYDEGKGDWIDEEEYYKAARLRKIRSKRYT